MVVGARIDVFGLAFLQYGQQTDALHIGVEHVIERVERGLFVVGLVAQGVGAIQCHGCGYHHAIDIDLVAPRPLVAVHHVGIRHCVFHGTLIQFHGTGVHS